MRRVVIVAFSLALVVVGMSVLAFLAGYPWPWVEEYYWQGRSLSPSEQWLLGVGSFWKAFGHHVGLFLAVIVGGWAFLARPRTNAGVRSRRAWWVLAMLGFYGFETFRITRKLAGDERVLADPAFTPLAATLVAWLVLVPALLLWYWLRAPESREASPPDVEGRARTRYEDELYWWTGDAPIVGTSVAVVFALASLCVGALSMMARGLPANGFALALVLTIALFAAFAGIARIRVKWLRRRLTELTGRAS